MIEKSFNHFIRLNYIFFNWVDFISACVKLPLNYFRMKLFFNRLILLVLTILLVSCGSGSDAVGQTNDLKNGANKFVFTYAGLPQKPINVFYNIPAGDRTNMPIVFVFHGKERNASDYRDIWTSASNQYGFMVFAPEFNDTDFPGTNGYSLGNVYQDGNNPSVQTLNNESVWTFSVIEPLFDYIKGNVKSAKTTYDLFGHSGGGQFVHRFVMFKPNARFNRAVAANSGWYTVPDGIASFPVGIVNCPVSDANPTSYFGRKLYITVGELDTNSADPSLVHNTAVDLQGMNRFDRANYFFAKSRNYATAVQATFAWQFRTVPNSGHNATLMSNDAIKLLFQ
ncbi:MAG: hypothetical protein CFE24_09775 [Flavobacterium sp. BFFFF2]|nr:MAG: hypothetical protein CFE24_09775 [Flavobacterium sp. BFFFF2]